MLLAPSNGTAAPTNNYASNGSGQYTSATVAPRAAALNARLAAPRTTQARKKRKPAAPKSNGVPGLAQYLTGDATFQQQKSLLQQQLENYKTANESQKGNITSDYNTALQRMGLQSTQDKSDLQGDFASRGLVNSGLYSKANADYDTKYQQQLTDNTNQEQRSLSDLLQSLQNYQLENSTGLQAAQQDAIRRRAQKYGLATP